MHCAKYEWMDVRRSLNIHSRSNNRSGVCLQVNPNHVSWATYSWASCIRLHFGRRWIVNTVTNNGVPNDKVKCACQRKQCMPKDKSVHFHFSALSRYHSLINQLFMLTGAGRVREQTFSSLAPSSDYTTCCLWVSVFYLGMTVEILCWKTFEMWRYSCAGLIRNGKGSLPCSLACYPLLSAGRCAWGV